MNRTNARLFLSCGNSTVYFKIPQVEKLLNSVYICFSLFYQGFKKG